jgi:hypothetical protein
MPKITLLNTDTGKNEDFEPVDAREVLETPDTIYKVTDESRTLMGAQLGAYVSQGINIPQLQGGDAEMQTGLSVDKYARQAVVKAQPGTPNIGGAVRNDGPTVAEYVAAGYSASNYPPEGFASRSSADEFAAAIAAGQGAKPSDGLTVPELEAALTAKDITIPAGAKKADLQKLLDEAV